MEITHNLQFIMKPRNGIHLVYLKLSKNVVDIKRVHLDEQLLPAATTLQNDYQNLNIYLLKGASDEQELFGSPDREYGIIATNEEEEIISALEEQELMEQPEAIASHKNVKESTDGLLIEDIQQTEQDNGPRLRYPRRDRRAPVRISINAFTPCRSEDGASAKEAIAGNEAEE